MIRLETVEDFEKIKSILDNPRSKSHQYRIKEFGYCADCNEVTQFKHFADLEMVSITCFRCGSGYNNLIGDNCVNPLYLTYLEIDRMPHWAKTSVNEQHSRTQQRKFFNEALEEFIKKQKTLQRKANAGVRRLAKLRS